MPGGRPSDYSKELGDKILEEIGTSNKGLEEICRGDDMPNASTVYRWLAKDEEFCKAYTRAKEDQLEVMQDDILAIADDSVNDWVTRKYGDTEVQVPDVEAIQRSRLRIETRKWLMSKLKPKKYGDKLDLNHSGDLNVTLTDRLKEARERAKNGR